MPDDPETSPFDLPAIIMEKVKLAELLDLLRTRINKSYMPTASGEIEVNSKPEYVRFHNPRYRGFPHIGDHSSTGFYAFDSADGDGILNMHTFVFLNLGKIKVTVDLSSLETLIKMEKSIKEVSWSDSPYTEVAIDRFKLMEELNMYL